MLQDVTLILLTDGRTSRGTRDDSRLLDERALLEHMAENLGNSFASIIVSANILPPCDHLGIDATTDWHPGSVPLAGIATALARSQTEWSFCVSCDMPLLTADVAGTLRDRVDASAGADVVIPFMSKGLQPMAALYSKRCHPVMAAQLRRGERRIFAALADLRLAVVEEAAFNDSYNASDLFLNLAIVSEHKAVAAKLGICT